MTVYKRKASQPLKWLVAIIIFALALGVTFTDVYGGGVTNTAGASSDPGQLDPVDDPYGNLETGEDGPIVGSDRPPTAIPEPSTLLLLAGGLSALYVARRRKSHKK